MEKKLVKKNILIYTDGACKGNPGPGGWGAVLIFQNNFKEIFGGDPCTTNNKMELTAAIKAIEVLSETCNIKIFTDSSYLKQGITLWIKNWIKNNWLNSNKQPIKNKDLWMQLWSVSNNHSIEWFWVKAHNNNKFNERADFLANLGIKIV